MVFILVGVVKGVFICFAVVAVCYRYWCRVGPQRAREGACLVQCPVYRLLEYFLLLNVFAMYIIRDCTAILPGASLYFVSLVLFPSFSLAYVLMHDGDLGTCASTDAGLCRGLPRFEHHVSRGYTHVGGRGCVHFVCNYGTMLQVSRSTQKLLALPQVSEQTVQVENPHFLYSASAFFVWLLPIFLFRRRLLLSFAQARCL